ncbi:hypothetical protein JCM31598_13450 [Desulfonatronum parangueonense]
MEQGGLPIVPALRCGNEVPELEEEPDICLFFKDILQFTCLIIKDKYR